MDYNEVFLHWKVFRIQSLEPCTLLVSSSLFLNVFVTAGTDLLLMYNIECNYKRIWKKYNASAIC